jgi:RNA polymerase sigma-70 factor (ECF subfamily)
LLGAIAGQNREALAEFYALFQRPLFTYFSRLTANPGLAEDLLVNLMLAVWQEASTYQEDAPVLVWLLKLAHRLAFGALPATNHYEASEPAFFELKPASFKHFTSDEIGDGLAKLYPGDREILILAFYHKFSSHEIAAITGRSAEEVKHSLAIARVALKAVLLGKGRLEKFSGECPLELWGWYVTQTLSLPELAQAELHLRQCPCCCQDLLDWRELQEAIFTTVLLTSQSYLNLFESIERALNHPELAGSHSYAFFNQSSGDLVPTVTTPARTGVVAIGKWWQDVKKQLALRRARRQT